MEGGGLHRGAGWWGEGQRGACVEGSWVRCARGVRAGGTGADRSVGVGVGIRFVMGAPSDSSVRIIVGCRRGAKKIWDLGRAGIGELR